MHSFEEAKPRMEQAFARFEEELQKIRSGRANPNVLASVMVESYGQKMPLKAVGNVVALDAQMLQITPFDPSNLAAISAAIRDDASLGLNPADDGKVVRVPIPPLTTERRQQIVKQIHEKAEQCRVAIRTVRHDVLKATKQQEKDGEVSQDTAKRIDKQVSELMDDLQVRINTATKSKEDEVMTI